MALGIRPVDQSAAIGATHSSWHQLTLVRIDHRVIFFIYQWSIQPTQVAPEAKELTMFDLCCLILFLPLRTMIQLHRGIACLLHHTRAPIHARHSLIIVIIEIKRKLSIPLLPLEIVKREGGNCDEIEDQANEYACRVYILHLLHDWIFFFIFYSLSLIFKFRQLF